MEGIWTIFSEISSARQLVTILIPKWRFLGDASSVRPHGLSRSHLCSAFVIPVFAGSSSRWLSSWLWQWHIGGSYRWRAWSRIRIGAYCDLAATTSDIMGWGDDKQGNVMMWCIYLLVSFYNQFSVFQCLFFYSSSTTRIWQIISIKILDPFQWSYLENNLHRSINSNCILLHIQACVSVANQVDFLLIDK
jgi:hypothetical protein